MQDVQVSEAGARSLQLVVREIMAGVADRDWHTRPPAPPLPARSNDLAEQVAARLVQPVQPYLVLRHSSVRREAVADATDRVAAVVRAYVARGGVVWEGF